MICRRMGKRQFTATRFIASLLAGATILIVCLVVGASGAAEALSIRWTPDFIPVPLPPFPIPLPQPVVRLDVELLPDQVIPFCDTPCLLGGILFSLTPGVPTIPGQSFFDIEPAPGFMIASTDNTTFLNLTASSPLPLALGTEIEVIRSFSTRNINPFLEDQVRFEGFGSFGSDAGFVEPVPEPSTLLLLGSSLAGLGGFAWRRRRK
jgi:hypothetical protein